MLRRQEPSPPSCCSRLQVKIMRGCGAISPAADGTTGTRMSDGHSTIVHERCLSARMSELFIYKVERKTEFTTEMLLKALTEDSMKTYHLLDGGGKQPSVSILARRQ
ncbi:hypothetical protein AV530_005305 [Patagioenas fasciata monilis]|uniref:Uncharacterized protein n=1 Tax=Patagioenas fasciata monilis TaxID=372326 RepID=A0A1V4JKU4_PATFA|nr:hypothetical protein AV530_005305 [Patagioenas fasciata monilis]